MTDQTADFDGCNRRCRKAVAHTRVWGECEFGIEPEPTVSMSRVYTDFDGQPSIGFDVYTVDQLAELLDPVLGSAAMRDRTGSVDLAHLAAHTILHRNDDPAAVSAPVQPPTRADVLREAIARVEDPKERAKSPIGLGLGWEAAREVLRRMLHEQPDDGPRRMAGEEPSDA